MKIKVRITGDGKAIVGRFKKFEKSFLAQTRIAGKESNKELRRAIRVSMEEGEWPRNEEDYLKWKSLYGYATRPLFRTRFLYNSVSHELRLKKDGMVGQVGWNEGARYPGDLKGKVWRGRVPKTRRKAQATASGPHGPRKTSFDTNYLAQVAYWNEHGEGGVYKVERVARRVRNGRVRNRQKYRSRYYDKKFCVQYGRIARPFVERAFNESDMIPGVNFQLALDKTIASMFGGVKGFRKARAAGSEIPF